MFCMQLILYVVPPKSGLRNDDLSKKWLIKDGKFKFGISKKKNTLQKLIN